MIVCAGCGAMVAALNMQGYCAECQADPLRRKIVYGIPASNLNLVVPIFLDEFKEKRAYIDACMQSLGICLNLLDPEGSFPGMPDEAFFRKAMNEVREDYRKLSDAILALKEYE